MITKEERERGARLRAYCAGAVGVPVIWGVDDCSMWPAVWAVNETGREAAWPVYRTKQEANLVVQQEGGLANVWTRLTAELGLQECEDDLLPVGSIGVVSLDREGTRQIGCIFAFGNIGNFRTEEGCRTWSVRRSLIVRAWALPQ